MTKNAEQIEMLSGKLEKYQKSMKSCERENQRLKEDLKLLREILQKYDSYTADEHEKKKKQNKVKKIIKITEESFDGDRTVRTVVEGTSSSSKSPGKKGRCEVKLDPRHLDSENYM